MTSPRLFVLGLALIAIHVIDDSFVQPQAGTSASDHLVSGLVPLALLALAAWAYPRLRGGRQGAMALAFGVFGIAQAHTRMLARHGYGVLLFDRRGEGESEGDPTSWGWGNEKDIKAGIGFLQRRADVDPERIGGLGLSVGGEMMIQTAAETDALKAVASEGAGMRSVREALDSPSSPDKWLGTPFKVVETAATAVFHDAPPPANLGDLVAKVAPRPLLLMYSGHGQGGEVELSPEFFRAAGTPKTLWKIPGAGHAAGIRAQPDEYERRVVAFFDDALL